MAFQFGALILFFSFLSLVGCGSDESPSARDSGDAGSESHASPSGDISLALTPAQMDWVGQQIFRNECAGKFRCLVHWNEGEAFPSLGIGHFIWYPKNVDGRFVESFPELIQFMLQHQASVPDWLRKLEPFDAPWQDRAAFKAVEDAPKIAELREFLAGTQGVQARFIFQRAQASLTSVIEAAPDSSRRAVRQRLVSLSSTPGGVYGLVDYVNFKGEGLAPTERYKGQGWGLLQVLVAMKSDPETATLEQFRQAAARVLTRRAENADKPIERERWLPGWLKRLETYKEPPVFSIPE